MMILFLFPLFVCLILGRYYRKSNPVASKNWYIAAIIYLIIGVGFCGSIVLV
jgi:hypothetical protein